MPVIAALPSAEPKRPQKTIPRRHLWPYVYQTVYRYF